MLPPRVLTVPPSVLVALVLSAALCGATVAPTDHNTGYSSNMPRDYGGVAIAGGESSGDVYLDSVEVRGTYTLPDLPKPVAGNTLTVMGDSFISCGGYYQDYYDNHTSTDRNCYKPSRDGSYWDHYATLPQPMADHTAVTVGGHIWFILNDVIYDLNTVGGKFIEYEAPFKVGTQHCAVSNNQHSFVLGVGSGFDEIWLSTEEYSAASWKLVGHLSFSRSNFGCLWIENYIVITGGYFSYDNVELFDVNTFTLTGTGSLVEGREGHRMFVKDWKPAVVGGVGPYEYVSSIETFNFSSLTWTFSGDELDEVRQNFGMAQLIV